MGQRRIEVQRDFSRLNVYRFIQQRGGCWKRIEKRGVVLFVGNGSLSVSQTFTVPCDRQEPWPRCLTTCHEHRSEPRNRGNNRWILNRPTSGPIDCQFICLSACLTLTVPLKPDGENELTNRQHFSIFLFMKKVTIVSFFFSLATFPDVPRFYFSLEKFEHRSGYSVSTRIFRFIRRRLVRVPPHRSIFSRTIFRVIPLSFTPRFRDVFLFSFSVSRCRPFAYGRCEQDGMGFWTGSITTPCQIFQ